MKLTLLAALTALALVGCSHSKDSAIQTDEPTVAQAGDEPVQAPETATGGSGSEAVSETPVTPPAEEPSGAAAAGAAGASEVTEEPGTGGSAATDPSTTTTNKPPSPAPAAAPEQ